MTTPTLNDYLQHFGIKGQKWGVRRSNPSGGSGGGSKSSAETTPVSSIKRSQLKGVTDSKGSQVSLKRGQFVNEKGDKLSYDAVEARITLKKLSENPSKVSTKELQTLITRLDTEQKYSKLNPPPPRKGDFLKAALKETGQKRIKDVLESTSRTKMNQQLEKLGFETVGKSKKSDVDSEAVAKAVSDGIKKAKDDIAASSSRSKTDNSQAGGGNTQNSKGSSNNAGGKPPPPRYQQTYNPPGNTPKRRELANPTPIITLEENPDGSFG